MRVKIYLLGLAVVKLFGKTISGKI